MTDLLTIIARLQQEKRDNNTVPDHIEFAKQDLALQRKGY